MLLKSVLHVQGVPVFCCCCFGFVVYEEEKLLCSVLTSLVNGNECNIPFACKLKLHSKQWRGYDPLLL